MTRPDSLLTQRIRATIDSIPPGCVSTYGAVAALAGLPGRARLVARILSDLEPGSELPWQRVVAAGGRIATSGRTAARQRRLLRAEGVAFRGMRADLALSGWSGEDPPTKR